jgi:hypothetical protein
MKRVLTLFLNCSLYFLNLKLNFWLHNTLAIYRSLFLFFIILTYGIEILTNSQNLFIFSKPFISIDYVYCDSFFPFEKKILVDLNTTTPDILPQTVIEESKIIEEGYKQKLIKCKQKEFYVSYTNTSDGGCNIAIIDCISDSQDASGIETSFDFKKEDCDQICNQLVKAIEEYKYTN